MYGIALHVLASRYFIFALPNLIILRYRDQQLKLFCKTWYRRTQILMGYLYVNSIWLSGILTFLHNSVLPCPWHAFITVVKVPIKYRLFRSDYPSASVVNGRVYTTYDHSAYNGKGQQFYYTHCNFNIPIQMPIAKFISCRSVVAGL